MTFSIVGRCARTGMLGVAVTTSSICVASRCPWARAGVGAVSTQNVTDPQLGTRILNLIESGDNAASAVDKVLEGYQHSDWRQIIVVDKNGNTAEHTGREILGTFSTASGVECYSAGNLLSNTGVTRAMVNSFAGNTEDHLAERLIKALRAGIASGGEMGPVRSAGVKVADKYPWLLVDLRVDWSGGDPVEELHAIWKEYQPQMNDYTTRAVDPGSAPSYGVAGDP